MPLSKEKPAEEVPGTLREMVQSFTPVFKNGASSFPFVRQRRTENRKRGGGIGIKNPRKLSFERIDLYINNIEAFEAYPWLRRHSARVL